MPYKPAWDTTERKCLSEVLAELLFRPYLEGTVFVQCTVQHGLNWKFNLPATTEILGRWRLRQSEFNFEVVTDAGVLHQVADAL